MGVSSSTGLCACSPDDKLYALSTSYGECDSCLASYFFVRGGPVTPKDSCLVVFTCTCAKWWQMHLELEDFFSNECVTTAVVTSDGSKLAHLAKLLTCNSSYVFRLSLGAQEQCILDCVFQSQC